MKLIPYVNIKMGTKSIFRRSNGNTLPLTQLPFGMVSFGLRPMKQWAGFTILTMNIAKELG